MAPPIQHATTLGGLELPVIDVTHPAFRVEITEPELRAALARFLSDDERLAKLPRLLRTTLLRLALRGSLLGRGLRDARGAFLGAIETYLLRLRPEHLGSWAKPIDRRIVASLPSLALRLRLQDMARLMADSLAPSLRERTSQPLHFLNLAGGTAIDTLNALLVVRSEAPELLARPISIDVLDRERAGPAFGEAALRALRGAGAPLHGLEITFRYRPWSWRDDGATLSEALADARAFDAIMIASSEGGLFEYGTDPEIVATLNRLRDAELLAVVGSVTRADEPVRRLHRDGGVTIVPRGLEPFRRLVGRAGWSVPRAIERTFSDHVVLSPSSAARG